MNVKMIGTGALTVLGNALGGALLLGGMRAVTAVGNSCDEELEEIPEWAVFGAVIGAGTAVICGVSSASARHMPGAVAWVPPAAVAAAVIAVGSRLWGEEEY